jgi:hypothetical protein
MNRYEFFKHIKTNIDLVSDINLKSKLDTVISPLYLFFIKSLEGTNEKTFIELSLMEKFKILPSKLLLQIKNIVDKIESIIAHRISNKQMKNVSLVFYPIEPTHIKQMLPISIHLHENTYLYVTDRIVIYKTLCDFNIKPIFINKNNYKSYNKNDYIINNEIPKLIEGLLPTSKINTWVEFCKNQVTANYNALYNNIDYFLTNTNPKTVVVGYDVTPEGRLCVKICKEKGIKTVCLQHGSIAGEPLDGEHIVDNYLLYGKKVKDYLISIGNVPENLLIFGAPYLDHISVNEKVKKELNNKLKLQKTKPTVLVALSGPGHCTTHLHFDLIVRSVIKIAKSQNDFNFIFKLHRKDKKENYTSILKEYDIEIPIIEASNKSFDYSIFEWLSIIDVLVTGSSTVALESMLLEKPVITVDYLNEYLNIDFIEEKCTFHVTEEDDLLKTIKFALNVIDNGVFSQVKQNSTKFINSYFKRESVSASKRIADWLVKDL